MIKIILGANISHINASLIYLDLIQSYIMNITDLHDAEKTLSVKSIFKLEDVSLSSMQIKEGGLLKEHITKTPAILLCLSGLSVWEDEHNNIERLNAGDYVLIEPMVKHWVRAEKDSQLVLLK